MTNKASIVQIIPEIKSHAETQNGRFRTVIFEKLSNLGNKRNVSWVRVTWDACSKLVVLCHTKQGHMMTS